MSLKGHLNTLFCRTGYVQTSHSVEQSMCRRVILFYSVSSDKLSVVTLFLVTTQRRLNGSSFVDRLHTKVNAQYAKRNIGTFVT